MYLQEGAEKEKQTLKTRLSANLSDWRSTSRSLRIFSHTFRKATIQGIDCSWLSVEEVKEKIENSIENTEICFTINQ